jgi:hypothetical protein
MRCRVWGLSVVSLIVFLACTAAAQEPPIPPEEQPAGAETLTRGPVHEAFAEPVTLEAEAGFVAPNQPPPNVVEYPPADRPRGDRYVWVPGYWSWDADRNDFIWVSACWRVAPPSMRWVPGYWTPMASGWEWVPGFWAPAGSQAVDYLPAPPAPLDLEPPGPPPGVSSVWSPGCWYWVQGRYVARHGYWLQEQPGWLWVPSHYRWSPRGYIFVRGHWDYALAQRGVLFAPVYFPPSVYARVGFSYTPSIVIDIGLLIGNLFAYPRYSHYYFGDYYDDAYVRIGIYPQFEGERIHTWYDPIYQHERWRRRNEDPRWEEHQRQDYDRRRADRGLRPARTYREQQTREATLPESQRRSVELAAPLRTVVARQTIPLNLDRMTDETRQRIAKKGTEVQKYRDQRVKWEAPAAAPPVARTNPSSPPASGNRPAIPAEVHPAVTEHAPPSGAPREVHLTRPERVRIPSSPVVDKPVAQWGKTRKAPPPTPNGERKSQAKQTPPKQQQDKQKETTVQKDKENR